MLDLRTFYEQIFEAWVGILAVFSVGEGLPRWIFLAVVPDREIMWVLISFQ